MKTDFTFRESGGFVQLLPETVQATELWNSEIGPKTGGTGKILGTQWSAIQLTTASAICAVMDIVVTQPEKYKGLVKQEQFSLTDLSGNRFGQYYA